MLVSLFESAEGAAVGELKSKFITVNGVRLHYMSNDRPDSKLMIFLHGFPEFWYSWHHQLQFFASDYHVVAIDQRGYNLSDKPAKVTDYFIDKLAEDICQVIKGLGYDDAIVVGHDWGGVVAWKLALSHQEYIDKLVIMNIPHPALFFRGG